MADGSITYKVEIDNKGAVKSLDEISETANKNGSKFDSFVAGIGMKFGELAADAVGSAIGAVGNLVSSSLEAFATFEQLAGGVETLYGESASVLMDYAANAYKTAQMSANQYMETATSFSASLISSLGGDTEAAVEYANLAITDMADNANKMGTSIESIQYAYQGFAKQNYTMLDNLKLGYGGTKEEMERLIEDANRLREAQGLNADLTIDSYADIVTAIHTVQEEMGIAGATAQEAATTIEGSVNMAKAAWQNWLTALGDDSADIVDITNQLVDSIATAASNVVPRVVTIAMTLLQQVPAIVAQLAPILLSQIQSLIPQIVALIPQFLDAALQLLSSFITALGQIVEELIPMIPALVTQICSVLIENLPTLIVAAVQLFTGIITGLVEMIPELIPMIPALVQTVITTLLDNIDELAAAAFTLFLAIVTAVPQIIGGLVGAIGNAIRQGIQAVKDKVGEMREAGGNLLQGLIDGIKAKVQAVIDAVKGCVKDAIEGAKKLLGIASPSKVFAEIGNYTMQGMAQGIDKGANYVDKAMGRVMDSMNFSNTGMTTHNQTYVIGNLTSNNQMVNNAVQNLFDALQIDLRMGVQGAY